MAIIKFTEEKIHPGKGRGIYTHLKNAIDYILKPEKTLGGLYCGSRNCSCATALNEMIETKRQYNKEPDPESDGYEHDRLAEHLVISWSPKEQVLPETALEITRLFCEEYLPDYEAVYSVHIDQAHVHTHIIFNSVNYKTGRKYHCPPKEWEQKLQPLLDRLCRAQGLHALEDDTGITVEEYAREARRRKKRRKKEQDGSYAENKPHSNRSYHKEDSEDYSYSDYIREDIDMLVKECENIEEFELRLKSLGYEVSYGSSERYGAYLKLRNWGMKRYKRTQTLGEDYTLEMINYRIRAYHASLSVERHESAESGYRYLFSRPVYHCRFRRKTDNSYLRKQYARMYRLGIFPRHGKRPSYRETMQRLKEIRSLEYQINLITERDYRTVEEIETDISGQEKVVEALKIEKGNRKKAKKPYEKMIAVYRRMDELEGAWILFGEGEKGFYKEAEEYEKLLKEADGIPHTRDELEAYLKSCTAEERHTGKSLREEKKKLKALKELRREYRQVIEEYAPAEDELLEEMEQHGAGKDNAEQQEKQRERRKER